MRAEGGKHISYLRIPTTATAQGGVFSEYSVTTRSPGCLATYHPDDFLLQSRLEAPSPPDSKCPHFRGSKQCFSSTWVSWGWTELVGTLRGDTLRHFAALDARWLGNGRLPPPGASPACGRRGALPQACLLVPQRPVPMCFLPEFSELQHTGLNGTCSTSEQEAVKHGQPKTSKLGEGCEPWTGAASTPSQAENAEGDTHFTTMRNANSLS